MSAVDQALGAVVASVTSWMFTCRHSIDSFQIIFSDAGPQLLADLRHTRLDAYSRKVSVDDE